MRISQTTFALHARSLALMSLALGAASLCSASSITYDVNLTIGAGSVTGAITTDGAIGSLNDSDILDWNLLLNDDTAEFDLLGPLSGSNSILEYMDPDLSATAAQLLFDFSGNGDFYFLWSIDSGTPELSQADLFFGSASDPYTTNLGSGDLIQLTGDFFSSDYNFDGSHTQFASLSGTQVIGASTLAGVPEPSTLALLGLGIALLGFRKLMIVAVGKIERTGILTSMRTVIINSWLQVLRRDKFVIHFGATKFAATVLLLAAAGTTLSAATILSVTGGPPAIGAGIFPFQTLAISFTIGQSYSDVSISPDLDGSFSGSAYLMTQIGAGTTVADEIASDTFTSTDSGSIPNVGTFQTVLQDVSIGPGVYFIVLSTTQDIPPQGWATSTSPVVVADIGASLGNFYVSDTGNAFAPSDSFEVVTDITCTGSGACGTQEFTISSASPTPEPASFLLLGSGLLLAGVRRFRTRSTALAA